MEQEAHFMNNYLVLKQDSLTFHSNCLYCIVVLQTHCCVILLSYRHIDQAGECKFNRNGVFRARLVALGYSQIPGIDFSENYSPVVDDLSFRLILLLIAKLKLKAWSLDVETAFLHGDLDEDIYMRIPDGFEESKRPKEEKNRVLKLEKSLYGLVQAARQWNRKFEDEIVNLGFKKNNIDPCVFLRSESQGFCVLCIYVDDAIITGEEGLMEDTIQRLGKVFNIKVQKSIEDFLGCKIHEGIGEIFLTQRRIVQKLLSSNVEEEEKEYKTPSAPGFFVIRPLKPEKVDDLTQKWFRSNIGCLLYLMKLSRPDLGNSVRELSKVMDGAAPGHVKELKRLIQFVRNNEGCGLENEVF
jgi:Reverse transcriptase (RNA-dependent DNA polymerase)